MQMTATALNNGAKFVGKVVKIDLKAMSNTASCLANYRMESKSPIDGSTIVTGPAPAQTACIHIIDLPSLHPNARGFRRGFRECPYAFLSPGEFNVPVRLDVCNFGIHTTKVLDLGTVDKRYGGYSGGFADGTWACFNPFRTFTGPFGGIRSEEAVDQGSLTPYFHAEVLCINEPGWNGVGRLNDSMRSFDLGNVDITLRGFSEAIRLGRFAYLSPLATQSHVYAGKVVRIYLGTQDIGATLDYLKSKNQKVREIIDILDLKIVYKSLAGFSGLFTSGKFLFLVPYRNSEELYNGQRGFGSLVRVDLNNFDFAGVKVLNLPGTTRSQIPSFADEDLIGFSGGFASGKYGLLVPFFNAIFSGKMGRFIAITDDMSGNVQVLNLQVDRLRNGTYKAYRGGFVSLWQGAVDIR